MYGQPLSWFQRFMQRFHPTPYKMAKAELKDAELAALHSQSKAEYASLRVQIHTLTVEYHQGRVARLKKYVDSFDRVDIEFKTSTRTYSG